MSNEKALQELKEKNEKVLDTMVEIEEEIDSWEYLLQKLNSIIIPVANNSTKKEKTVRLNMINGKVDLIFLIRLIESESRVSININANLCDCMEFDYFQQKISDESIACDNNYIALFREKVTMYQDELSQFCLILDKIKFVYIKTFQDPTISMVSFEGKIMSDIQLAILDLEKMRKARHAYNRRLEARAIGRGK